MRNLTDDEMKKMMDDAIRNSFMTTHSTSTSISPTDIDAKGMFYYQEPEQDEQGTFYGYKVLHRHCSNLNCDMFKSPRYPAEWVNGELNSDICPAENHMHGIHFTKRPNHPELQQHSRRFYGATYTSRWWDGSDYNSNSFLVKCALSGTIVETKQGFRAEHAQIIGVYINGNWQSYQDYQERTRAYSRPNPIYETWEDEAVGWRLTLGKPPKGSWTTYSGIDPSADS